MQLADRTLILKQKEFFVFIIATRLLWNHSPSEWFSLYKKIVRRKGNSADDSFAGGSSHAQAICVVSHCCRELEREER